jgi:isoleucyl-tRNA synthetase
MLSEWWEGKDGAIYVTPEEANSAADKPEHFVGKMSKSKRNYREPQGIFDTYGADALRWYFFANQPPWTSIRYSERQIKESIPEFLLRLWNVYSFFVLYANIDGFCPADMGAAGPEDHAGAKGYRPVDERGELDRWVISELNLAVGMVVQQMDNYDNFSACRQISAFVDALSNWYVRRSRDRFWATDTEAPEKLDAYWTLYECLTTVAKLVAPFVPFTAEAIWQNLARGFDGVAGQSVHLCDYPTSAANKIDATLTARMNVLRDIASAGRSARMGSKLKVRQPLAGVTVILNDPDNRPWLEEHAEILRTELNVKAVEFTTNAAEYVTYQIVPNFKRLGPRVGKLMPAVKQVLGAADGGKLLKQLTSDGRVTVSAGGQSLELDNEDIEVRLSAKDGWAAAQGNSGVVVLSTELTPELLREGIARDVVRLIQDRRKELDLQFTDRIDIWLVTDAADLKTAIDENRQYIMQETLCTSLNLDAPADDIEFVERELGSNVLRMFIRVAG